MQSFCHPKNFLLLLFLSSPSLGQILRLILAIFSNFANFFRLYNAISLKTILACLAESNCLSTSLGSL